MPEKKKEFDFDPEFKDLIRQKAPRLFGRAGHTRRHRDDVEQEIATQWLERLEAHPESAAFPRRVLNQIVSNMAREAPARRQMRCRTVSLHVVVKGGELAGILSKDRRRRDPVPVEAEYELREMIAGLPKDLRAVAEGFLTGLSATEIARRLSISRGTVYRRLGRVIERLRARFFEDS